MSRLDSCEKTVSNEKRLPMFNNDSLRYLAINCARCSICFGVRDLMVFLVNSKEEAKARPVNVLFNRPDDLAKAVKRLLSMGIPKIFKSHFPSLSCFAISSALM